MQNRLRSSTTCALSIQVAPCMNRAVAPLPCTGHVWTGVENHASKPSQLGTTLVYRLIQTYVGTLFAKCTCTTLACMSLLHPCIIPAPFHAPHSPSKQERDALGRGSKKPCQGAGHRVGLPSNKACSPFPKHIPPCPIG